MQLNLSSRLNLSGPFLLDDMWNSGHLITECKFLAIRINIKRYSSESYLRMGEYINLFQQHSFYAENIINL